MNTIFFLTMINLVFAVFTIKNAYMIEETIDISKLDFEPSHLSRNVTLEVFVLNKENFEDFEIKSEVIQVNSDREGILKCKHLLMHEKVAERQAYETINLLLRYQIDSQICFEKIAIIYRNHLIHSIHQKYFSNKEYTTTLYCKSLISRVIKAFKGRDLIKNELLSKLVYILYEDLSDEDISKRTLLSKDLFINLNNVSNEKHSSEKKINNFLTALKTYYYEQKHITINKKYKKAIRNNNEIYQEEIVFSICHWLIEILNIYKTMVGEKTIPFLSEDAFSKIEGNHLILGNCYLLIFPEVYTMDLDYEHTYIQFLNGETPVTPKFYYLRKKQVIFEM